MNTREQFKCYYRWGRKYCEHPELLPAVRNEHVKAVALDCLRARIPLGRSYWQRKRDELKFDKALAIAAQVEEE